MAQSTRSSYSNGQPRTPPIAAGRKRKRTVDDDEDVGCAKRICTSFVANLRGNDNKDSSDESLFSDCGLATDETSTPSSLTPSLSEEFPRTPTSLDPHPFLNLPNRPEIFFDTYDEDFGEKVTRHYEIDKSLEGMLHRWRIQRYGKAVAETYRENHTPEHFREEYIERMDRLEKELEASDTDDD